MRLGQLEIKWTQKPLKLLNTRGITNRTQDNYFVPFFDYDCVNLEMVEQDADFLQKNFFLGDYIILRSSSKFNGFGDDYGNYHLIFFTKHRFPEIIEFLRLSRCDNHFKHGWKYQNRTWVLRVAPKIDLDSIDHVAESPSIITHITSPSSKQYSYAHLLFFKKYYSLKINIRNYDHDNLPDLELINYETKKKDTK